MNNEDIVPDDEDLYRRVPAKLKDIAYSVVGRQFIIHPAAFRDRYLTPSVYRAKLVNDDPTLVQSQEEDGVIKIKTVDISEIKGVATKHEGEIVRDHSVYVVADPIDDITTNLTAELIRLNSAHALIKVKPKYFGTNSKKRNAFDLLKIKLAILANENGWIIEPTPP